jgi:hypothetical protein
MTVRNFEAVGPPSIAAAAVTLMLTVIVGCGVLLTERTATPPTEETAVACNGKPNWCLVARSELIGHRPAYVYVDGEMKGLVLPEKTVRFAMTGGTNHLVNFCQPTKVPEWTCSTPANMNFESGNATLVIYPLTAGVPGKGHEATK